MTEYYIIYLSKTSVLYKTKKNPLIFIYSNDLCFRLQSLRFILLKIQQKFSYTVIISVYFYKDRNTKCVSFLFTALIRLNY